MVRICYVSETRRALVGYQNVIGNTLKHCWWMHRCVSQFIIDANRLLHCFLIEPFDGKFAIIWESYWTNYMELKHKPMEWAMVINQGRKSHYITDAGMSIRSTWEVINNLICIGVSRIRSGEKLIQRETLQKNINSSSLKALKAPLKSNLKIGRQQKISAFNFVFPQIQSLFLNNKLSTRRADRTARCATK